MAENMKSLWYVGQGVTLFAGRLTYNALHAHSVPILITGLYEKFGLRLENSAWVSCAAAVIPAGVHYELDVRGEPLSVLYLEPTVARLEGLLPLLSNKTEWGGVVIGETVRGKDRGVDLLRGLYEDPFSLNRAGDALSHMIEYSQHFLSTDYAERQLDGRILKVLGMLEGDAVQEDTIQEDAIQEDAMEGLNLRERSAKEFANYAGLSVSRFQHLFSAEVGVPFRRYRAWQRLKIVIKEVMAGGNLTSAAHLAGYYDQAHFGHHFRQTFGAAPGKSMINMRSYC